ncbi:MAG: T9SS type A sorting domain-containing protein [Cytophagales bacterium]|nr:T9SS type A sorting domain-containing protein [Cytophagales bacterium]
MSNTYIDTLTSLVNGCDSTVTTNLTVLPANTFSQSPTVCAGQSVTVGTNTYTVSNTYIDTLTSLVNGCDSTVTTNLTVLPANTFSQSPTVCAGESVTVGTNTYTVSATYTDTLTAVNSCDSIVTTNLTVLTAITDSVTIVPATCGSNNGTATVTATGGTTPYTYLWSTGDTTDSISGLAAGSYWVSVTDSLGCNVSDTISITEPDSLSVSFTVTNATCNGVCDGAATAIVSGGTPPYTYLWDDPSMPVTQTFPNLCAGTYSVTITDSNGCTATGSVTISTLYILTIGTANTNASCIAVCNGTATGIGFGGTEPYSYLWDDPSSQTTATATNLCAGTYNVAVTDSIGCLEIATVTVISTPEMILAITPTDATCGNSDGSASVAVTFGTLPYTYSWSSGDTLPDADSLASGIYVVTVTDDNGCSNFEIAIISDNNGPVITVVAANDITCNGGSDGSIAVSVSGGTAPFTYQWSNGSTGQVITGLVAGPYELTVTDSTGCIANKSVTLTQPDPFLFTVTTTDANCGNNTGSATVSISGGVSPYIYQWGTGGTDSTEDSLTAGVYTVSVSDANNCTDSATAAVSDIGGATITIDSIIDGGCGADLGSIYITLTGGSGDYTYLWSNNSSTQDLVGVSSGTYSVTVTDTTNGCIATESAHISGVPATDASICLVTVDSATGSNLVVWEKLQTQGVQSYNIYRESSQAGTYYLIGNVPVDSVSVFTDTLSNPLQQAYRYRISVVDSCGNESEKSQLHKTMHLTINEGLGGVINLIWDHYEGFGFLTYYIHRYTTSTGWVEIDSIASTLTSRTDFSPPPANLSYRVVVKHPASCDPNLSKVLIYNSARSNVSNRLLPTGVRHYTLVNDQLKIYPNPAKDELIIEFSFTDQQETEVAIYNLTGNLIYKIPQQKIANELFKVDFSGRPTGIYYVKVKTPQEIFIKKIVLMR